MIPVLIIDGGTREPLPLAAAVLYDGGTLTTTGAVSDNDGIVELPQAGRYLFRTLGYAHFSADITEPVTVELARVDYGIDEFEVVAYRSKNRWPLLLLAVALILE